MELPDGILTYSKITGYQIRTYQPSGPRQTIHLPYSWCAGLEFVQNAPAARVQTVYCILPHPKADIWGTIRIRIAIPANQSPNRAVNLALQHLQTRLAPAAFILWARRKLNERFPEYQNQKQWRLYLKNLIAEWSPETEEGRNHLAQTLGLGDFQTEAFPRNLDSH